ncbi:DUF3096 domain-containing protein [Arthrobacter sp. 24S4-2]|uniref:DUF3096 domain-containing protein n=1 Tax=Arthrobacter sp. 24S4-2 TaxID=2575374 RepID=UPI0010C7DE02|nr:DUF3096 domain-containing protein [Arthrobacter sp. 24S4-2]QCO98459.1 DUF3096 domain-containing protein [Arthrobacter sp. 24S4-2]
MAVTVALIASLPACAPNATDSAAKLPFTVIRDVPLPGCSTRLDYQVTDPAADRLYIAPLGDGTVHVLDLIRKSSVTQAAVAGVMVMSRPRLLSLLMALFLALIGSRRVKWSAPGSA